MIFASRKPEAENFRAWVFEEALPTIRKTGTYSTEPQDPFAHPDVQRFLDFLIHSDLTQTELRALCLLRDGGQFSTYQQMAEWLGVNRGTAHKVVKRLRERGLLEVQKTALLLWVKT